MYSYWLKPDPFARYRKSHQVARWHLILYIIIIGEHVCPGSVLAPWHLLGEGSESMCVCVSALSVMMHCMLETFLCHVFLLAQARSIRPLPEITPSGQVAFNSVYNHHW